MAYGKLQFSLFMGEEALPVDNAQVIIINEKILNVDKNGKTKEISLYTYEKILSQKPDEIQPYKTYDALILCENFQGKYIEGIPVFEGVTSIQKVQMQPRYRGEVGLDTIKIPPNGLLDSTPYKPKLGGSEKGGSKILSQVVIPEYITIHLGSPSSYAQNVTVPFTEYIKNVASSEVYPTWPREALASNIYAILSFTLNRIYTEWYRSRGYDFDITNSTAYDHYFVNGRNIFDTISVVVDEIFDEYISRESFKEPLLAQYCNGTTVTCAGMSQWGTVSYAEEGYTAFQILTKYYSNNIELREAAYQKGTIQSYPGKALRVGDSGEDVKTIQMQLNRIRKNYPAIPVINNVNGDFNEITKSAVKEFQKVFNLSVDGIVGKNTWYKISQIYVGVKKLAELNSEGEDIQIPEVVPTELLRLGSTGENVKILQYLLICISTFYDNVMPVVISGTFDEKTLDSVKSFQLAFNLSPDGIVGPLTWNKLLEVYRSIEPYILTASGEFIKYPGKSLKKGSRGENVKLIQKWINEVHKANSAIPALNDDGIFGDKTFDAVKKFQRYVDIVEDGIVGKITWDKLYGEYIKLV